MRWYGKTVRQDHRLILTVKGVCVCMWFLFLDSPFNTEGSLQITATEARILSILAVVAIATFLLGILLPNILG